MATTKIKLLQIFLDVVEFGMNAQSAIEAPRFQTRHLVSSFDNHAMNRGDLLLDERIAPNVYSELTERGHKTAVRSRWSSGGVSDSDSRFAERGNRGRR